MTPEQWKIRNEQGSNEVWREPIPKPTEASKKKAANRIKAQLRQQERELNKNGWEL